MRFTPAFVSIFAASAVTASAVPRSLCDVGLPCWVQAIVNDTVDYVSFSVHTMNTAVAAFTDLSYLHIDQLQAAHTQIVSAGNALESAYNELVADVYNVDPPVRVNLAAALQAATTPAFGAIDTSFDAFSTTFAAALAAFNTAADTTINAEGSATDLALDALDTALKTSLNAFNELLDLVNSLGHVSV